MECDGFADVWPEPGGEPVGGDVFVVFVVVEEVVSAAVFTDHQVADVVEEAGDLEGFVVAFSGC